MGRSYSNSSGVIMPDGKTHLREWTRGAVTLPIALTFSYFSVGAWQVPAGILVGYAVARYVTPDLDQVIMTDDEFRMMNELKLLGAMLVGWFVPYSYIMRFVGIGRKGHRNFFSHTPFIGTVIRLAWLMMFPPIGYPLFYFRPEITFGVVMFMFGVLWGMTMADAIHWMADIIDSALKKAGINETTRKNKNRGNRRR